METSNSPIIEGLLPAATIGAGDEISINGEWLEVDIREVQNGNVYLTCSTDEGADRMFVMELNHMHKVRKPLSVAPTVSI